LLTKRLHDAPAKGQNFHRDQSETGRLPGSVYGTQIVKQLSADRRAALEGKSVQGQRELFGRAVGCQLQEMRLQLQIAAALDFDVSVPAPVDFAIARSSPTAIAD
jgi:hypothetical protein